MQIVRLAAMAALVVAGSVFGAPRAAAQHQSTACRGPDSTSADIVREVVYYTTATDSTVGATRDSLRLPLAQAWQVVLVTDKSICAKAASAYARNVAGPASRLSGRVYVVKAGTMKYVVVDPTYYYSDAAPNVRVTMVLDSRYKLLSLF